MCHGRSILIPVAHDITKFLLCKGATGLLSSPVPGSSSCGVRSPLSSRVVFEIDAMLLEQVLPLLIVVRAIMSPVEALAETKVRQLHMSLGSEEEVVGFDVSVDVAQPVGLVNSQDHLCDVEARKIFLEDVLLYQKVEEISSSHEFPRRIILWSVWSSCHKDVRTLT
jgi:hypothetical protein